MDASTISRLLSPFLESRNLSDIQLQQISAYLDLLLRWNARMNLTAVRDAESIVTRHFGESLFAARHLFPAAADPNTSLIDIGSGAGFPGIPIKLWNPQLQVTLIESNHKKATFLREVVRTLGLTAIDVHIGRAEEFSGPPADVVTLRAVERFEDILPIATRLTEPGGKLLLLVGVSQQIRTADLAQEISWDEPIPIPLSQNRILLVGRKREESS
jgi:16S rRNA (guanine527-N7)-methyltransferase